MNKLSIEKQAQIIGMLVEGNSMRATARMADVSFNTVLHLVPRIGKACAEFQSENLKALPCKRLQCDEIWNFVACKEKNVPESKKGNFGIGDVFTWVAMCADTKIVPAFLVGKRGAEYASLFIADLAKRLKNRVQLTTDGHHAYLNAIEDAFGGDIDYAMLVKLYGNTTKEDQRKYSPVECTGTEIHPLAATLTKSLFRPATSNGKTSL